MEISTVWGQTGLSIRDPFRVASAHQHKKIPLSLPADFHGLTCVQLVKIGLESRHCPAIHTVISQQERPK
jgi:hypothetical protein